MKRILQCSLRKRIKIGRKLLFIFYPRKRNTVLHAEFLRNAERMHLWDTGLNSVRLKRQCLRSRKFLSAAVCMMRRSRKSYCFWRKNWKNPICLRHKRIQRVLHERLPRFLRIIVIAHRKRSSSDTQFRKFLPEVLYANLYGPTEITDACTYYIVDREFSDDVSISPSSIRCPICLI